MFALQYQELKFATAALVAAIAALAAAVAQSADTRSRGHAPKPHDIFKDCATCPEMVVVPAGEFMMGSPNDEAERLSYESPRHMVRIATPFAVGRLPSPSTSGTPASPRVAASRRRMLALGTKDGAAGGGR
jgi:formylglycine-generating enzyme required for sulfatase activity